MRSKEAIAILRGFCKQQSKTADLDGVFAKGILAAIRWMTEENSPVPYPELEEDMPEDGGWVSLQRQPPAPPSLPLPPPVAVLPAPNIPQFVPPAPVAEGSSSPVVEEPSRLVMPGSFTAYAEQHPWLREIALEGVRSEEHGRVELTDRNAVVVGGGLGDAPVLSGGEGGY